MSLTSSRAQKLKDSAKAHVAERLKSRRQKPKVYKRRKTHYSKLDTFRLPR